MAFRRFSVFQKSPTSKRGPRESVVIKEGPIKKTGSSMKGIT